MKNLNLLQSIKDIPTLESLGVDIEFEALNEETSPFDMFDEGDEARQICERYDNGNSAAWFCAHVTVKYKGIEYDDYLGCCSYSSFKEFTSANKDYYFDMINTCIEQINKDIEFQNEQTQKFWNIRKAKNLISPYGLHIVSTNILHTL